MAKKEIAQKEDFRYLVRIVNTDLDGKRPVVAGLTYVKGISERLSRIIADQAGVPRNERLGNLTDAQLEALVQAIDGVEDLVPAWMRNRQNDPATGEDAHFVGTEVDIQLREDLNRLKKIRSWRGMRHERNMPVRGQRTRSNGRTGMTVGVQRKAA